MPAEKSKRIKFSYRLQTEEEASLLLVNVRPESFRFDKIYF